jgi:hypothetical protein
MTDNHRDRDWPRSRSRLTWADRAWLAMCLGMGVGIAAAIMLLRLRG